MTPVQKAHEQWCKSTGLHSNFIKAKDVPVDRPHVLLRAEFATWIDDDEDGNGWMLHTDCVIESTDDAEDILKYVVACLTDCREEVPQ